MSHKPRKPNSVAKSGSTRDQRPSKPTGGAKNTYLLAYNAVSAALWAGVLYKTLATGSKEVEDARNPGFFFGRNKPASLTLEHVVKGLGSGKVYDGLEAYTRVVQTLAGAEVLHSLVGMFDVH
jgi:very-long-chain (3R)-3-hydroxyacyl-CoA dehydratase